MYVKRVFYDDFKDLSNVEKSIVFPTWEDIEKVINLLDGQYVTQITMDNGNEDDYLCIGGGNDGLCNVFVSKNDNEIIYTLMNSDSNDSLVHKLVTGGQEGDFEDKLCVSIEIAKCVSKMYYELGQMDDSFIWE
ncbi:MAG: hypothetical protein IJB96_05595 [Lachnospira sp.]|nr:hypothetical protein [Lachnospira sp.]